MSTDIRAALENLLFRLDATTDRTGPVPAWVDSYYAARAVLAQTEGNDIPAGPLSEQDLCQQWNAQADELNQWDSLDTSEQLAWAQDRAVAVDRNRRVALVEPGGEGPLPTNYIDSEHQGKDLELLQTFYQACASEGGTADEICLRGIRAVLARWGRPAAPPVPGGPWRPIPAPLWGVPGQAAAPVDRFTNADRLALALCVSINGAAGCPIGPCEEYSRRSTAVARELAAILREHHGGSSQVADWLDGVGEHP